MRLPSKIENFLTDYVYTCVKIGQSYCILRDPCERAFIYYLIHKAGLPTYNLPKYANG